MNIVFGRGQNIPDGMRNTNRKHNKAYLARKPKSNCGRTCKELDLLEKINN